MKLIKCHECDGKGWIETKPFSYLIGIADGFLVTRECPRCGGEGFIEEPEQIKNPVGWVDR